jgi:tRNA A37 threonylcarbamoyladenosine dehydratase
MDERFLRNELYFGNEKNEKLKRIKVCVVGLGGVGSYAIEALARIGVEDFVIIDKDVVDVTNINRQIIALESTIGKEKCGVVKERILQINPSAKVKEYSMFYGKENSDIILKEKVDYVVDAIDTISCKWELIKVCLDNDIKFISCMGMGNREDLTKIEITTLDKTNYDPVAKKLRELVRKENRSKDMKKIKVVFSNEIPIKQQKVINKEGETFKESYPPASIIFVPSVAGFLCAYYICKDVIK